MAISFVGSYVGIHPATSVQTVNFSLLRDESNAQPTLLQDDYVIVAIENASTVDRTQAQLTPSGYTALHTDDYRNDSNDSNFLVSAKFMGSTPDTSVGIPASNATTAGVGYAIYVFRGLDTTTPMDATPVVTGNINTGIANAAAITPVTTGAWVVAFAGAAVAIGTAFTNPAGMSTTTNHFRSTTLTTTTNDPVIGGAIYTGWTSGAYDPAVFGGSTSTNTGSWSAVTLALRPYVATPTTVTITTATIDHAEQTVTVLSPVTKTVTAAAIDHSEQVVSIRLIQYTTITAPTVDYVEQSITTKSNTNRFVTAGSVSFSGQEITINSKKNTIVTPQTIDYSEQTVNQSTVKLVSVAPSIVDYSEQVVTLNQRKNIIVTVGSYTHTPSSVSLNKRFNVTTGFGTMDYTEQLTNINAQLRKSFVSATLAHQGITMTVYNPVVGSVTQPMNFINFYMGADF